MSNVNNKITSLTGCQASRKALGIIISKLSDNNDNTPLSDTDLNTIQRLSMIEHVASRQERFLDIFKKSQGNQLFWNNINEIIRYLTIPITAYLTNHILTSFKSISRIIAELTLKVIRIPFVIIINLFLHIINILSTNTSYITRGWIGKKENLFPDDTGENLINNITFSVVNNSRILPLFDEISKKEWDIYLIAFFVLYLFLLVVINFSRIWISANQLWTPLGGISNGSINNNQNRTIMDNYGINNINHMNYLTDSHTMLRESMSSHGSEISTVLPESRNTKTLQPPDNLTFLLTNNENLPKSLDSSDFEITSVPIKNTKILRSHSSKKKT